ncbi:MAG: pseudouridine synthase [Planctomycetota bacterium]
MQRTVRSCTGCGLCCTETFNTVRILPVEAACIVRYLERLTEARRAELVERLRATVRRYRLRVGARPKRYTCSFLEKDLTCALPFDVKPVACLAFNPQTPDRCDMDSSRYEEAYEPLALRNAREQRSRRRSAIPLAVLLELDQGMRPVLLPRLLSKWHVAPRKRAEEMVRAGRVTVNGIVRRDVLFAVHPERDRVAVDGRAAGSGGEREYAYFMLNKPRGVITSTRDPRGRVTVMDLEGVPRMEGLAPAGRLDQASAGLLLLTNDHDLASRMLDPQGHVPKRYRVKVRGRVGAHTLERLRREAVESEGLRLEPLEADIESVGPNSTWLRMTLRQGKNRQIRRQLAAFGHEVLTLVRTGFGPLELGELPPGGVRSLSREEVAALRGVRPPVKRRKRTCDE